MNDTGVVLVVVVFLAVAMVLPLISIWALNTLFLLGIEYSVWTWLAAAWLHGAIAGPRLMVKRKGN